MSAHSCQPAPRPLIETDLRAGALGFPEVLMQGITHIAPAVGLVLTIQFVASVAGLTTPLAFLCGFLIVLTLGIALTQLARRLPSAGGYYTYVSRTVGPRAGFLTAWVYFLYDPALAAINLSLMGYFFESTLRSEYGIRCPWWLFFLVATALITFLVCRGIAISAGTMMLLGAGEIAIVVALACFGLLHPGPGGVNLAGYLPRHAPTLNGLYLGVVFTIFCFTGFEAVAPLAEESRNPRRNLPRAIIGSILCMGVFFLFCSWAVMLGWGTQDVAGFVGSRENPCFVLARRFWGHAWVLIFIAVLNSILAVAIACTNAATRVLFAMSRSGALPKALARVHPLWRTPMNAIFVQTAITLTVGLGLGFWIGPDQEYYFMGLVMTLGLALVYGAGNYAVFHFYRGTMRGEFRFWLHAFCPAISTLAMIAVAIASLVPLPPAPLRYAPAVVVVWICAGVLVLRRMSRTGTERWLVLAGETAHAASDEPKESRA